MHRGLATQRSVCDLFRRAGLLVEDDITVRIPRSGIVEQIDGVVELDGRRYLLEVRDHSVPLSAEELAWPILKARSRAGVGLILVSASGYTRPAVEYCQGALRELAVVLVHLDELVALRDPEGELPDLLRAKVHAAELYRDPYLRADGWTGSGS
ncbi:MAG TPA: hypothetical protein VKY90_21975 [Candidatus Dormibacteraeota bacterium]|nr:hypothetical protein [Candidatus Dormibacteraeota bacterium]